MRQTREKRIPHWLHALMISSVLAGASLVSRGAPAGSTRLKSEDHLPVLAGVSFATAGSAVRTERKSDGPRTNSSHAPITGPLPAGFALDEFAARAVWIRDTRAEYETLATLLGPDDRAPPNAAS